MTKKKLTWKQLLKQHQKLIDDLTEYLLQEQEKKIKKNGSKNLLKGKLPVLRRCKKHTNN